MLWVHPLISLTGVRSLKVGGSMWATAWPRRPRINMIHVLGSLQTNGLFYTLPPLLLSLFL
jgi:hypothetical protein